MPIGKRIRRALRGPFLWFSDWFFNPLVFLRRLRGIPHFARNLRRYTHANTHPSLRFTWRDVWYRSHDRYAAAGEAEGHYFFQDLWAARFLHAARVREHVDVGSRIDGFVAHVLPFCMVRYVDIRPLPALIPDFEFRHGSIVDMPFESDSIASLSSLHVIEHIGLGRYGDPVDPDGHLRAAAELSRVLAPGGHLLLGTPVGRERLCFDAHRIFDPETITRAFPKLELAEFSLIDDTGKGIVRDASFEGGARMRVRLWPVPVSQEPLSRTGGCWHGTMPAIGAPRERASCDIEGALSRLIPPTKTLYRACRRDVDRYNGDNNSDITGNGELDCMRRYLPHCKVVFDVGANVGDWAALALQVSPDIELHCFEPSASTYAQLTGRGLPGRVVCNHSAMGAEPGERILYRTSGVSALSSLYRREGLEYLGLEAWEPEETVTVDCVDAYCARRGVDAVDFIKVDVEGNELEVLRGMSQMLRAGRIGIVQFEYGGSYIDARVFLGDIWRHVLASNPHYRFYKLTAHGIRHVPHYAQELENFQLQNWLIAKAET